MAPVAVCRAFEWCIAQAFGVYTVIESFDRLVGQQTRIQSVGTHTRYRHIVDLGGRKLVWVGLYGYYLLQGKKERGMIFWEYEILRIFVPVELVGIACSVDETATFPLGV